MMPISAGDDLFCYPPIFLIIHAIGVLFVAQGHVSLSKGFSYEPFGGISISKYKPLTKQGFRTVNLIHLINRLRFTVSWRNHKTPIPPVLPNRR